MPTEDLGDPFFLILCLLKILVTNSYQFYVYWRSWRFNGDPFILVSFQFPKIIFLLRSKKDHARVCQFWDWQNRVDMKWYDYMKRNKKINYIFLKEKQNCRLKVRIINVGGEILIYKHYAFNGSKYVYISWSCALVQLCYVWSRTRGGFYF